MKTSLGHTPGYYLGGATSIDAEIKKGDEKPPVHYPSFRIEGKAAEKLCRCLEAGDEIEATVKLKVLSVSERVKSSGNDYMGEGSSVEVEVTDIEVEDPEPEEEETAEEAIDSYRKGKK